MPRKRFTSEQIISKLREAEVALAKGKAVPLVCKQIGVTEQTYYRWRKEYGGLKVVQAKKLRELEKENARLKKLVADMALDNDILKEARVDNEYAVLSPFPASDVLSVRRYRFRYDSAITQIRHFIGIDIHAYQPVVIPVDPLKNNF